jgi:hypothetical protein
MFRRVSRPLRIVLWVAGGLLLVTGFAGMQADSAWALVGFLGALGGLAAWIAAVRTLVPARRFMPAAWFRPVHYGLTATGLGWVNADGIVCFLPWAGITRLETREDRLVLIGRSGTPVRLIPRAGLDAELEERITTAVLAGVAGSATMTG